MSTHTHSLIHAFAGTFEICSRTLVAVSILSPRRSWFFWSVPFPSLYFHVLHLLQIVQDALLSFSMFAAWLIVLLMLHWLPVTAASDVFLTPNALLNRLQWNWAAKNTLHKSLIVNLNLQNYIVASFVVSLIRNDYIPFDWRKGGTMHSMLLLKLVRQCIHVFLVKKTMKKP